MKPLGVVLSNVPIKDIKPYLNNPRKNEQAVEHVMKSIEKTGYRSPIVVDENMVILAGHTRWKALKKLGWKKVPKVVQYDDMTEEMKKEYRVRDNKTGEYAEWDFEVLGAEFSKEELADFGFDKELMASDIAEDEPPQCPTIAQTKKGDIYELGNHRLLCGDSTIITDVEKLMDGKKADMVFTDPPYGVAYEQGKYTGAKVKKKFEPIKNDEKTGGELYKFIQDVFTNTLNITTSNAIYYVWSQPMFEGFEIATAIRDVGIHLQSQLIWDKGRLILGRADYHWQHEVCWYGYRKDETNHYWCGDRTQTTIWKQNKDSNYEHPTQKPVALAAKAINNSTQSSNNSVVDLFLGSGSTLIACEQTNRICYGMELDEKYCDVIVQRYVNFTKNTDIVLNGKKIKWGLNATR